MSQTLGELIDARSKLRAEHNVRNADLNRLKEAQAKTMRAIREITYQIQDLYEKADAEQLNLNDIKGKK